MSEHFENRDFSYLHEVPFFDQSSQDVHCGYYCAIMLLVAVGGKKAWEQWWNDKYEANTKYKTQLDKDILKQSKEKGLELLTLRQLLEEKGKLETEWFQIDGAKKSTKTKAEQIPAEQLRTKIIDALKENRPSILRLPHSFNYPYGHYVVIKGFVKTEGKELFIVNDPLVGESSLLASEKSLASALAINDSDAWGGSVLISKKATFLHNRLEEEKKKA